jgi:chemotaxis protein methyltransferase CheR
MMIDMNDTEFTLMKDYLHRICGIDIPADKSYLFKTRLTHLLNEENFKSFNELYVNLKDESNTILRKQLIEFMTTNETSFFRDGHPYDVLLNSILPQVYKKKIEESVLVPPGIRVWSSGCSTGQEAYSLAIILSEWAETVPEIALNRIQVMATDISPRALNRARAGTYDENEIKRGMKNEYLEKYFVKDGTQWTASDKLKSMIIFNELNLSHSFSGIIGFFDIILCRNVIIYFSREVKSSIVSQFHRVLNPGGVLILGASENLYTTSDDFVSEHFGQTIVYRAVK